MKRVQYELAWDQITRQVESCEKDVNFLEVRYSFVFQPLNINFEAGLELLEVQPLEVYVRSSNTVILCLRQSLPCTRFCLNRVESKQLYQYQLYQTFFASLNIKKNQFNFSKILILERRIFFKHLCIDTKTKYKQNTSQKETENK